MIDVEGQIAKTELLERQKSVEQAQKEREGKPSASLKMYFSVEKFQVSLLQTVSAGSEEKENFM